MNKKIRNFFLVLLSTLLFSVVFIDIRLNTVHAAGQRCYQIDDKDQQNLCLAIVENRSSRCHSIRSLDNRHFCLAYVGNNTTRCYSIRNKDSRTMCLALIHAR